MSAALTRTVTEFLYCPLETSRTVLESQRITRAYEEVMHSLEQQNHVYLTERSRLVAADILPRAKMRRTQEGRATNFKKILLPVAAALQ